MKEEVSTTMPPYPAAYYLCTEAECQERQSSGEISIFESQWPPPSNNAAGTGTGTSSLARASKASQQQPKQSRRMVNPRYAMTKYRRSAAGVDKTTKNRRSVEQLECCLQQLEYILCFQQQPPPSNTSTTTTASEFPKQTLTGSVSFVEDRIRAIQVDLVVSQQASKPLQYRIVQCHILILYLLGNVKTYESKFGQQALSAALTNYWLDQNGNNENENSSGNDNHDDEMLCFMALQQLCQYCLQNNNDSSCESLSLILDYYRRNVKPHKRQLENYPKLQWALYLVELAVMGRPQSLLRQLAECDTVQFSDASFTVLCRCCVAPIIDRLRYQALDQYNKTYMKGEKVSYTELARLLYFSTADEAGGFCANVAGLTRHEDGDKIVFKVGPITIQQDGDVRTIRQDAFVFGTLLWKNHGTKAQHRTAWGDENGNVPDNPSTVDSNKTGQSARVDAEGVLIPPSELLFQILQGSAR